MKKKKKIGIVIGTALLTLLMSGAVYAQDSAIDVSLSGAETNDVYTSDIDIEYDIEDETGIKTVSLVYDGKTIDSKAGDALNETSGKFTLKSDWLASHEPADYKYDMKVVATDVNDDTTAEEVEFYADASAPEASVTGVENGATYNAEQTVKVSISDRNLSQDKVTLTVKKNGMTVYSSQNPDTVNGYTYAVSEKGDYEIAVSVTDKGGHKASDSRKFAYDNSAPDISGVKDGEITNQDVTVKTDAAGGKQDVTLAVLKDGSVVFEQTGKEVLSFTASEDGRYEAQSYTTDMTGAQSKKSTLRFIVDKTAPTISDIEFTGALRPGYTWYYDSVSIAANATDDSGGITKSEIRVNGKKLAENTYEDQPSVTLSAEVLKNWIKENKSKDGSYAVQAIVTDAAGNTAAKEDSFFADVEEPSASIHGFKDHDITNEPPTAEAKIEDEYGGTVEMKVLKNGAEVFSDTGQKTVTYEPSQDGAYIVTAVATDNAGNVSETAEKSFKLDRVKPEVDSFVVGGHRKPAYLWYDGSVLVTAALSDDFTGLKTVEMTVNGEEFFKHGPDAALTYSLEQKITKDWFLEHESENGMYTVVVRTEDMAGNERMVSTNFYADVVRPSVAAGGIANGTYTRANPTIATRVHDNYPSQNQVQYTIYRDGKKIKTIRKKGEYSSIQTFYKDGDYVVLIKATDKAGNTSETKKIKFTRDTVAPVISLTGASQKQYYNTAKTISANIKERNYQTVTASCKGHLVLDGKRSAVSFGAIKPTRVNYTKSTRFSANGTYTLTLTASDKAGNKAKPVSLIFTVDTQKPKVEITGVKPENGYESVVAPKVVFSDIFFENRTISLTKSGKAPQGVTFSDSKTKKGGKRVYRDFTKDKVNDGIYTLTCTVKDKAGNVTTEKKLFKVNRYGSVFVISKDSKEISGTYLPQIDREIVIVEKNITGLRNKEVVITKDGMEEPDPKVSIKEATETSGEKLYGYTIKKDNFTDEGVYQINIVSEDTLGNFSELSKDKKEFKFYIDKTPPTISLTGIEEGGSYPSGKGLANVSVNDSISLAGYKVFSGNTVLYDTAEQESLEKSVSVDIPKGKDQTISVSAVDKAGNTSSYEVKDVTVGKGLSGGTLPVRMLAGAAGGAGLLAAAIAALFVAKRRRQNS